MSKKFIEKVPKKPFLKKETYSIPRSYVDAYQKNGVINSNEQVLLFHLTQFGGFRTKKDPSDMNYDANFIEKWFKKNYKNGYYHFKANTTFLQKFGNLELKPLEKRWRTQFFNYDEMYENGFSKDEINESAVFLKSLNEFYSSLRLNIEIPNTGITAKDRIQLQRFHGIPYLTKKPKAGGRFFNPETSYQRISSSLRPFITINGEKTSEMDLKAATLQFLNITLKNNSLNSLEDKIISHLDPYDYFLSVLNSEEILFQYNEQPIKRDMLKEFLYTAIYSSKNRQESNVTQKLRVMGKKYNYKNLVSLFPEFFTALTELKTTTGIPLHLVINREESRYAQEVLQKGCLEQEIAILPLHDSFITTLPNVKKLKEIMDEVSISFYGKYLSYKKKY